MEDLEGSGFSLKKFLFGKINRKFCFVFGIILLTLILMGVLIIYFQTQVLNIQFVNSIAEAEEDFFDIQKESVRTLSVALEVISQDEAMKQVYLEKDREKMFDYGQPLFQELKDKYMITHFNFILPNGTEFVRLHNKDIYGDEIKRTTFLKAQQTKNVVSGIELGKTAYALRVVMPYYDGSELIGYVEMGQEIDEFLAVIKKDKANEFSLIVEKELLKEDDWASSRKVRNLRNNWDDLREHVVISETTDDIFSRFSYENVNMLETEGSFLKKSELEDKIFACGGFAFLDAAGEKSGVIFSLIDVTDKQDLISRIRIILLFVLLAMLLLFVGFGLYVSRNISKPIGELDLAAKEIRKKNFKARVDIKTGDELQELGNSFNETARALGNMDKEYRQLEKAKTEFLSITSHELRSPMTPMQAQLQMLAGEYYGKLNAEQLESLDIVVRNTKRLDNIIVDFLEISRIEAARLKFRFVKKNPADVVSRLVREMKGFMSEKKVEIVMKIGKLPVIEHDPDRLSQALRNLMNNAIKFCKPGCTIVVSASLKGDMIEFSVADKGIGIRPEDQKRIFEPFFQAEQTIYREHQGTGLGLAIIRGIVESQGGKVWLKSKQNVGTTFYFTLPLKPVRVIKPIKLLFSKTEDRSKRVEAVFMEALGPMGTQEFDNLDRKNQLNKKDLIWYIDILIRKGILSGEDGEVFKGKILRIFGEVKE